MPDALISYPATVTGNFGVPATLDGLLINSASYKATRTEKVHNDHRDIATVFLYTNPVYMVDVDARVIERGADFGSQSLHPGLSFTQANVPLFVPELSHGFDSTVVPSDAFFVVTGDLNTNTERGDLDSLKFSMRLIGAFPDA